jgi:excisionase family DNA binding protein
MNAKTHDGQPAEPAGNGLLNKLDVAQWLDVSVGTVDNLRREGKLRAIKVGSKVRFKQGEVERYLESERENVDGAEVAAQDGGAKKGRRARRNRKVTGKEQKTASRDGAAEERKPTK